MGARRTFTVVITEKTAEEYAKFFRSIDKRKIALKVEEAFPDIFLQGENLNKAIKIREQVRDEFASEFRATSNQSNKLWEKHNDEQSSRISALLTEAGLDKYQERWW